MITPDEPRPDPAWVGATVYTLGHSTRPQEELIDLLQHYGVATLADVRTVPRSRHNPQFNRDELAVALPGAGIAYVHLARLGGLRKGLGATSPNTAWRNHSFRGYADYMQTSEFQHGLSELRELCATGPVALMCAEAVPWRCHRSLIADALFVRGMVVHEIQSRARTSPHRLTPFARLDGYRITYPGNDATSEAR
ncbi:MAG: DUF488 domain-containing protein [Chloroflexota bacterium]|nr:DUF488 domain-containing protein [Chloroflexota bacterium]